VRRQKAHAPRPTVPRTTIHLAASTVPNRHRASLYPEHPIERLYRDARLIWLEEGTPTIQYMVADRELLSG
jgi:alkylation response protein AidB-like acyl-CoA dehydrogenase